MDEIKCPRCNSTRYNEEWGDDGKGNSGCVYMCKDCGYAFDDAELEYGEDETEPRTMDDKDSDEFGPINLNDIEPDNLSFLRKPAPDFDSIAQEIQTAICATVPNHARVISEILRKYFGKED